MPAFTILNRSLCIDQVTQFRWILDVNLQIQAFPKGSVS